MKIQTKIGIAIFFLLALIPMKRLFAQEGLIKFKKIQELKGIEEYLYEPNGLNLLLLQDNSAPVVTIQVVYHVGSKNETPGNTGATHLLEHLNFKGTPSFNKQNGNAIFKVLQDMGAEMNATTWNDRTNYYETIPSDKIETALHIESDRMRNSLLLKKDKEAEMTVVRNEFERGENNPINLLFKEIWATAYLAHPYHHSTIGWRSDIENMSIETLRKFYNTYYWPNNATLTIIGDFQKDSLFGLVDKYFGKIGKAPHDIPQPYTEEPEQVGPRRIVIKKPGQQSFVSIGYKIPGMLHEDLSALTVLGNILGSGTSSIINRTFVDSGIALFGFSGPSNFKEVGLFMITLGFTPDKNHEDINMEMLNMVEKIKANGVLQDDVDRIVAKLNTQTILSRDGSGNIAGQINEAIAGGDWTNYFNSVERLGKVTADDVKRVANKYLIEEQSTTGYFIPQVNGVIVASKNEALNFKAKDGKYFFRTPVRDGNSFELRTFDNVSPRTSYKISSVYGTNGLSDRSKQFDRKQVAGIDVVTAKTGAKDFVTISASFPIGDYLNKKGNKSVPDLTTQILSKGTSKNDKFQFSQKLEKLGVTIDINADTQNININFKCLTKDLNIVISLLAEELRYPLFDAKEFELLKTQNINGLKRGLEDPNTQASIALSQSIYPQGHPNYRKDIESSIKDIEAMTLEDLKGFHKTYFGPKGMHLVAVGDVNTKNLYSTLNKEFRGWYGGITTLAKYETPIKANAITKVITIPKKPSAVMNIGQYTGIKIKDKDFLPFYIGVNILGGDFSARLMQTVRDRDGLTYGINSKHSGHKNAGGYWEIVATFNPSLFEKGLNATMAELNKWVNEGVTIEELMTRKTNLTGSFKVGLASTTGLAKTLLDFIEMDLEPSYIDQYPKDIEAVTLKEVNSVIKKYINLNKLVIIKSGSLDENGVPSN
ncbi:pitrilysin family protein [Gaetbulibacter sp. M235]|uniref:M16 family metallopeptidase n=1 Tax=Gaetbulibacter sp. M235 TaxID=3126510 RepID=UPI00374F0439